MKSFPGIGALIASAAAVVLISVPQLASAQATRTWVSGTGDDANPCSRTAPCKTFAGAISKTATGGEMDCLDPGGFGTVTITKAMTIDCKGAGGGILSAGTIGIVINAGMGAVVIRNLSINGVNGSSNPGTIGIRVIAAGSVLIEDSLISEMGGNGIEFTPAATTRMTLNRVSSINNGQHGVLVAPTGFASMVSVYGSDLSGNVLTGIRVNDLGFASVTDSLLASNGTHGASAVSSGGSARISLDRVTSSANVNGGVLASGSGAVIYLSTVLTTGNAYGLYPAVGGGQYISFGNNRATGNTTADGSPTSLASQF